MHPSISKGKHRFKIVSRKDSNAIKNLTQVESSYDEEHKELRRLIEEGTTFLIFCS